ncbi:MAG TPA: hypothetical protein VFG58_03770 [Solirubrobacterales bacterium]|nr:hypothetical protein [Solirubrobacterales bacterium]
MRSHAKAATAGSTKRQAGRLGRIFRGALGTRASSPGDPGSGASATRRLVIPTAVLAAIVAGLVLLAGLAAAATSAITEPATNIGGTHATINGVVNPEGVEPEECFFEWGEGFSGAYTETTPCAETPAEIGSGTSPVSVHADITGLAPQGTYYHFRLAVVNSPSETLYGTSKYFSTLYTVVTEPATDIGGTHATLNGAVNPEGVEPEECFFEWGETSPYAETTPCAETPAEIGSGASPVAVHADITGLTPQHTRYNYRLVVVFSPSETLQGFNREFNTPNTVITEAATGVTPTEATLNGSVNPDGATITECVFEWGPPKSSTESIQPYPETVPCVPGPGSITGTSPVAVHADITGLHTGTTYHYRLKATYSGFGTFAGADTTVLTTGPAIEASWAEDVVLGEATLKAKINPEGSATTYRFEWGTDASYGSESAESSAGSGGAREVSAFIAGLQPGTTYHWRAVAENANGVNDGPDHVFVTYAPTVQNAACPNQVFRTGPAAKLPDCRGYEMVSPVEKLGADAYLFGRELTQSSVSGNKLTYTAYRAFGDAESAPYGIQYLASRGPGGWSTDGISPRKDGSFNGIPVPATEFDYFSPDLSTAWLRNESLEPLVQSAPAGQRNIYRRDNLDGSYTPVVTSEPPTWEPGVDSIFYALFEGASVDGGHAAFTASDKLTPDAPNINYHNDEVAYEWVEGQIRLVAILPNGEAFSGASSIGTPAAGSNFNGLPGISGPNAISADGSRIFWTAAFGPGRVFVRIDGERTEAVSESVSTQPARFWAASADGSKAMFSINKTGFGPNAVSDLYEFDVDAEAPSLIAHQVSGVLGTSEDASYVYFASREALDAGATEGEPNLYLFHGGDYTFIATLPDNEEVDSEPDVFHTSVPHPLAASPTRHIARVAPDGEHAVFVSQGSLTNYDNTVASSGKAAAEVYLYDAGTGQLSCPSCNPSGGRPLAGGAREEGASETYLAAASIKPWKSSAYEGRNLSPDGRRLIFEAYDALVPRDTNGKQDVYEWEAPGKGDCTEASASFSHLNGGCVSLVSTGASPQNSEFIDATPSGNDAFFRTETSLDPRDPGLLDIYDARVGGGFPYTPPAEGCSGDGCQTAPEPPHDPTPASASFHGAGNPTAARANGCRAQARRALKLSHRAKRLRRAAKRSHSAKQGRRMRRHSAHLAHRAKAFSKRATRCRRAKRRAQR